MGKSGEHSRDCHTTNHATTAGSGLWSPGSSVPAEHQYSLNFDLIIKNIKDLNVLAGEGSSEVTKTQKGAKLKVQIHCIVKK